MRASDVMTRDVVTCRTDQSAADAARVMWDRDCGVVPVVDERGALRGVVTDRDLLMASHTRGKTPAELPLSSLVPGPLETCREDSDFETVLAAMGRRQVRRLPVVDGRGRVVGIVSLNDLIRHAQGDDRRLERVAKTLAEIGRHRTTPKA